MKIIYNKVLPFKGFSAMMFFRVVLARKECKPLSDRIVRHEEIHHARVKDAGEYIPYYLLYLYWCIRRGYRDNPFEIEAYQNDTDPEYLNKRDASEWIKYR